MEFELSYRYLISLLASGTSGEKANKILDEAIRLAWLPKQSTYEIDDFIKICEQLKKEEGRIRIIGMAGIAQARCYRTIQTIQRLTKATS
jgi:hypothetical protein